MHRTLHNNRTRIECIPFENVMRFPLYQKQNFRNNSQEKQQVRQATHIYSMVCFTFARCGYFFFVIVRCLLTLSLAHSRLWCECFHCRYMQAHRMDCGDTDTYFAALFGFTQSLCDSRRSNFELTSANLRASHIILYSKRYRHLQCVSGRKFFSL